MSIVQWFPGHMAKAIRQIEERLSSVDCIIECRDARIPISSRNPLIAKLALNKPRIIILTKKDLSLESITNTFINSQSDQVICINSFKDNVKKIIEKAILQAMQPKFDRDLKRGIRPRMVRAMIVGVPNVGKSTLINQLVNKKVADTQNRPGVTMSLKQIKFTDRIELVDTPGLLWPKFETIEQGYHLALCLSVKNTGYNEKDVLFYGLTRLREVYPDLIDKSPDDYLSMIMKQLKLSENEAVLHILHEIQNHKFGPMSWDIV